MLINDVTTDIAAMIRTIRRTDDLVIERDTQIADLGVDSLDFVELTFMIEEKYDIEVEFNANTDGTFPFDTVGSAADAVCALIDQRRRAA